MPDPKSGIESNLLDLGRNREVSYKKLMYEMLEFIDDVIDDLGSKAHLASIEDIIENGSSADRQLKIFNETNDLKLVVDHLIKQTTPEFHNE